MGTSGLMSVTDFEQQIERFVNISNQINDDWQLVRASTGVQYMMKKAIVCAPQRPSKVKATSNVAKSSKTCGKATENINTSVTTCSAAAVTPETSACITPVDAASTVSAQEYSQQSVNTHENEAAEELQQLPETSTSPSPTSSRSITEKQQRYYTPGFNDKIPPVAMGNQARASAPSSVQQTDSVDTSDTRTTSTKISDIAKDKKVAVDACYATQDGCLKIASEADESLFLEELEMASDAEEEDCVMASPHQQIPLTYEYHVLYSESYSVPVLYFNIFTPDGKLLPLDEVWNLCPKSYQAHIQENKWATLTQQEHPLLGRPYLQLHPCHTADLMAQMSRGVGKDRSTCYLATWLSTVGPLIALKIYPEYVFGLFI